jgi:hypothetical protein
VNITVAALPTSGMAARTSPPTISQNVTHPSAALASGTPSARTVMNGRNPQMKNVVQTSTLRTPCMLTLW